MKNRTSTDPMNGLTRPAIDALRAQRIDPDAVQKWQTAAGGDRIRLTPREIVRYYGHRAGANEAIANVRGRFETAHDGLQHMAYQLTK